MVLEDYPIKGEEDMKYHIKEATRNLLNENIDVHSRSLIDELPQHGVKCISNIQYN